MNTNICQAYRCNDPATHGDFCCYHYRANDACGYGETVACTAEQKCGEPYAALYTAEQPESEPEQCAAYRCGEPATHGDYCSDCHPYHTETEQPRLSGTTSSVREQIHANLSASVRRAQTPIAPGQPTALDLLDQMKALRILADRHAEAGEVAMAAECLRRGRALKPAMLAAFRAENPADMEF